MKRKTKLTRRNCGEGFVAFTAGIGWSGAVTKHTGAYRAWARCESGPQHACLHAYLQGEYPTKREAILSLLQDVAADGEWSFPDGTCATRENVTSIARAKEARIWHVEATKPHRYLDELIRRYWQRVDDLDGTTHVQDLEL